MNYAHITFYFPKSFAANFKLRKLLAKIRINKEVIRIHSKDYISNMFDSGISGYVITLREDHYYGCSYDFYEDLFHLIEEYFQPVVFNYGTDKWEKVTKAKNMWGYRKYWSVIDE